MMWVVFVDGKVMGEVYGDSEAEAIERAVSCYRGQYPADSLLSVRIAK